MRYEIRHGIVKYAAETILQDVNFEIRDTEKIGVVGRNGCGKTTLLKVIAGELQCANLDSDEDYGITTAGTQRIGYLKQLNFENPETPVEEEIKSVFAPVFETEKKMRELERIMEQDHSESVMYEYSGLQANYEALGGYSWKQDMEMMFLKFGFRPEDMKRPIGSFSGGQQTRFAFIRLLLSRPDIMLLDEPTNHLDMPTIEWLEGYLKNYGKAVVIVSHDRMFLDNVTSVTYEIEYHDIRRYSGNYSAFMQQKKRNLEKQQKDYEEQQAEIARLTAWIEKWKNTPTKVAATRSKRMAIEHMVKIEKPRKYDTKAFRAQFLPRIESYSEVLSMQRLAIGYDHVLSTVTMKLMKGEKVAIIGANGKGKSTLLRTITGNIPALGGTYTYGKNVESAYFDQQAAMDIGENPEKTVLQDFWDEYPNMTRTEVRSALGSFLFGGEDVEKHLGQLSGGEKVRLALCKLFRRCPNLLLLDEPTNHMDIVGKDALENMLRDYTGTVLFVSHDRYFIRQVATGLLVLEEDDVQYYSCGYEEYLERKKHKDDKGVINTKKDDRRNPSPTLPEKPEKRYYNPGKEAAKREALLQKLETKLMECDTLLADLKLQLLDPAIATDYEKLGEIQSKIDDTEQYSETLLEELAELEVKAYAGEIL